MNKNMSFYSLQIASQFTQLVGLQMLTLGCGKVASAQGASDHGSDEGPTRHPGHSSDGGEASINCQSHQSQCLRHCH